METEANGDKGCLPAGGNHEIVPVNTAESKSELHFTMEANGAGETISQDEFNS